jgi:hypothetical protein
MKKTKLFYLLVLALFIGLASCEKNDELPGHIPGMGDTPGEIELSDTFRFPEGIHLLGEIKGFDGDMTGYSRFGSGTNACGLKIKFTLVNSLNESRTVFFPKGLVIVSDSVNYKNGILLQTTWVTIQANSTRNIMMELCGLETNDPDTNQHISYSILGRSDSELIKNLLDIIAWKKINYEMINGTFSGYAKAPKGYSYSDIANRLRDIVYNLTTYDADISSEDKAFINGIPDLLPFETPTIDSNGNFPLWFPEFVVAK